MLKILKINSPIPRHSSWIGSFGIPMEKLELILGLLTVSPLSHSNTLTFTLMPSGDMNLEGTELIEVYSNNNITPGATLGFIYGWEAKENAKH